MWCLHRERGLCSGAACPLVCCAHRTPVPPLREAGPQQGWVWRPRFPSTSQPPELTTQGLKPQVLLIRRRGRCSLLCFHGDLLSRLEKLLRHIQM